MLRKIIVMGAFAPCLLASLPGPAAAREKNNLLTYAAVLDLTGTQPTRTYEGAFVNVYTDGDVGVHGDFVHINREEDAAFFSAGVSVPLNAHIRPKVMIGTSTSNHAILPDIYGALSVEIRPGDASGWIFTPGIAYRHYRNRVSETIGSLGIARYFTVPWDRHGYYAAQLSLASSITSSDNLRASVSAGLQTVRRSGVTLGLAAEAGSLISDPATGTDYRGRYFALRPNFSLPILDHVDFIVRGEYADTQLYNAIGGLTGFKVEF